MASEEIAPNRGWHYQIVKYKHGAYGLHEVYQGGDLVTEKAVGFVEDSPEDIVKVLKLAMLDAEQWPVIDEAEQV